MPPWWYLPRQFYIDLQQLARKYNVSEQEVLDRGKALFKEREEAVRDHSAGPRLPHCGLVTEAQGREIYKFLSRYYYEINQTSQARRQEILEGARKVAQDVARQKKNKPASE